MPNAPSQTISSGHPRFIDVQVFTTTVDPSTGIVTTALDTTSPLVLVCNVPTACVPTVDALNNRRVILTAGNMPVGGLDTGWSVTVSCPQGTPAASPTPSLIPGKTLGIVNAGRVEFGTSGDV